MEATKLRNLFIEINSNVFCIMTDIPIDQKIISLQKFQSVIVKSSQESYVFTHTVFTDRLTNYPNCRVTLLLKSI